jgi:hypothetical protein
VSRCQKSVEGFHNVGSDNIPGKMQEAGGETIGARPLSCSMDLINERISCSVKH